MVEHKVKDLTGVAPERKLVAYLLHDTPLSNKSYKNSLLKHLLNGCKSMYTCALEELSGADKTSMDG